ncbi:MAG: glycerophosphodiester phosphodiesterase [Bacteroidetes bacterium]|nr:glycerophosphodiester phosphodiesterase [Bacteroidota bacterium]
MKIKSLFVLTSIVLASACHTIKQATVNLPAFDTEGHRGGRGLAPENTIPAMLKGLDAGVTTLEMDAMITKDRKVILSHDPFFNPAITTLPDGGFIPPADAKKYVIFQMDYADVQKYDVGLKPYPAFPQQERVKASKPLLGEVIAQADAYARQKQRPLPFYNIETKSNPATDGVNHPGPDEYVDLIMAVIKEKKVEERVIIQSFDPRTLQSLHKRYPDIKTALLIEGNDKRALATQVEQLGFTPTIYSPFFSLVNPALLKECHHLKMKVVPWTVNDKKEIDRLRGLGVDGIISDYPNLF